MKQALRLAVIALVLIVAFVLQAAPGQAVPEGGIKGKLAPLWEVEEWRQLPKGKKALELTDFKGKTVYLYAFQSWCPGCHSHGFPTLKAVQKHFKNDKDVVFLAVQTVFEGHETNTMARGLATLKKFDLKIPLGLSGTKAKPSTLMRQYRTQGTPWTIVIDKSGKVVANGFRVDAEEAIAAIEKGKKS